MTGDNDLFAAAKSRWKRLADQAAAALGHWQPSTSFSLLVLNVMSVA